MWLAAAVAGIAAAALIVVWAVDYVQHQRWLLEDAQTLQPYQHVLLDNGRELPLLAPGASAISPERLAAMARIILDHNHSQNILLNHLSMSDPRSNLWRSRAYVKVYIVTEVAGLPPNQQRLRKVKAVYTLASANGGWRLLAANDRTIE